MMNKKSNYLMVVDDDEDDRMLFCHMLNQVAKNIGCLREVNGQEALNYLQKKDSSVPDLIFLDINMPVMSGWEFLNRMKKENRLKQIPVIIFSTSSNPRDIQIAYDLGALSYCVKPDDPADLRDMLRHVVSNLGKPFRKFLNSDASSAFFKTP
jgi:CheY-like chemotaxis protein